VDRASNECESACGLGDVIVMRRIVLELLLAVAAAGFQRDGGDGSGPLADGQEKIRAFEERMRGAFTRQQAAAIFGMVGPPEPPEGLPLPAGTRLTP